MATRPVAPEPTTAAPDFDAFYRAQWGALVGLCRSIVGGSGTAEELAQEALFRAHERWSRVRGLDRPDLWVRRVATNLAISWWRRRRAEARAYERHEGGRPPAEPPPAEPDGALWDAVRALPRRQRAAVCLHYVDGLTTAEVGAVLGCGPSTVQTHLARARAALRTLDLDGAEARDTSRPPAEEVRP